jgi:broad specificity phosphatase PhoE
MKRFIVFSLAVFITFVLVNSKLSIAEEGGSITTLILVRHAEKAGSAFKDPPLTPAGTARAQELAYILKHVQLDAIFSTPFERTKLTVKPTAEEKRMNVMLYEPNDEVFLEKVLEEFSGKTVLIVGHSNTIPRLANDLAGRTEFDDLADPVYDNLFIASVPEKGNAVVLRIRFGAHTPEK